MRWHEASRFDEKEPAAGNLVTLPHSNRGIITESPSRWENAETSFGMTVCALGTGLTSSSVLNADGATPGFSPLILARLPQMGFLQIKIRRRFASREDRYKNLRAKGSRIEPLGRPIKFLFFLLTPFDGVSYAWHSVQLCTVRLIHFSQKKKITHEKKNRLSIRLL